MKKIINILFLTISTMLNAAEMSDQEKNEIEAKEPKFTYYKENMNTAQNISEYISDSHENIPRRNFPVDLSHIILEYLPYNQFKSDIELAGLFRSIKGDYHDYDPVHTHDSIYFSPYNGKVAVIDSMSAGHQVVKIFDTVTGNLLATLDSQTTNFNKKNNYIITIDWIYEDHLIIRYYQEQLLWDIQAEKVIKADRNTSKIINERNHIQKTVLESPNKLKIAQRLDGVVTILNANLEEEFKLKDSLNDKNFLIQDIAWSPDSTKLISGSGTYQSNIHNIIIWDIQTGEKLYTFGIQEPTDSVSWSLDGQFITVTDQKKNTYIFDTNLNLLQSFKGRFLGWSKDDSMFAAQTDNKIILYQRGIFAD